MQVLIREQPTYSPQCSIDMASRERGKEMDPDRIPLLHSDCSSSKDSEVNVLIKAGDPIGSPECEVRIIEAVQPDGKEIQIEVPAPPAPETGHSDIPEESPLPPTNLAQSLSSQTVKTRWQLHLWLTSGQYRKLVLLSDGHHIFLYLYVYLIRPCAGSQIYTANLRKVWRPSK